MRKFSPILFVLVQFFLWVPAQAQEKTVILLSKSYGGGYENWLRRQDSTILVVPMYTCRKDSVAYWLKKADGFLMSGGEDIYPARYGKEKDTVDCGDFDKFRDTLEYRMLDAAFQQKKPVFGICRGLQLLNVYLGGTLVVDIPSSPLGTKVNHRKDGPSHHAVRVIPNSSLAKMANVPGGEILSNHHQGIERLAPNLKPMADSEDGLVEAIENSPSSKLPFVMAVQWHPEHMEEKSPLSEPLARAFVKAVAESKKKKNH